METLFADLMNQARHKSKMFKRIAKLLGVLLLAGCTASSLLSPQQFTDVFATQLRQAGPQLMVTVVSSLELKVKDSAGNESTAFLDNAYDHYRKAPADRDSIVAKYVSSFLDTPRGTNAPVDITRIVPVIKDKEYLPEVYKSLAQRGQKTEGFMDVYEAYNSELTILYAEDSPTNIRYLTQKDLVALKIEKSALRLLAIENLRRLIPQPQMQGTNGIYILQAGGDYDASLILLDKIWSTGQVKVDGDIVVALPSRDLLMITGSSNAAAIATVRKISKETAATAPYRLTPELFVYRNGKFEVLRQ